MRPKVFSYLMTSVVLAVLSATPVLAVPYTIVDLGTLGGTESRAYGINASGQVVGYSKNSAGNYRAFLWDRINGMQDLGTLGGNESRAYGINDHGQVAGYSRNSAGYNRAFIWDSLNGMRELGTLPGGYFSYGTCINNAGQVAGYATLSTSYNHAFFWDSASGMRDLGTLDGPISEAYGINDFGVVVGIHLRYNAPYHGFTWSSSYGMHDFSPFIDADASRAYGINNSGQVVGVARTSHNYHAFFHEPGKWGQILAGADSKAYGINNMGQVVGSLGGNSPAFLWDSRNGIQELGTLSSFEGSLGYGVNDTGWVVGWAINANPTASRALLWMPVPEPSGILALGAGLFSLAGFVRRRRA